ncbi:MAG: hypothetical protein Kow0062_24550 [Acidobacteriota bacterium]
MRPTIPLMLALASAAIVWAAFVPGRPGAMLLAAAVAAFPPLLIALATARRTRPAARAVPAWGLAAPLSATLAALVLVPSDGGPAPGAGLLLMLTGLWLVPLAFVAWAYARWSDDAALDERLLERLRRLAGRAPARR